MTGLFAKLGSLHADLTPPNVQAMQGLLQNLLKTIIFRGFSCHLPNWMKNFTLSRLFFTFIWPLKVLKTLFTYFNHQIKSLTSLNCNRKLIQFVFSRGDPALCYIISKISSILTGNTKDHFHSFLHFFLDNLHFDPDSKAVLEILRTIGWVLG